MPSALVWADIPVTDMDRAMKFYGAVLQTELLQPFPGQPVAVPSPDLGPVAFDLVISDNNKPSATEGTRIYLSAVHGHEKVPTGGHQKSPPRSVLML